MIAQQQISRLSQRLYREHAGRRIPEYVLERDYCLAWFLVGLSRSPMVEKLLFKGGTLLRRCYFADYRFSEDLDFTWRGEDLTRTTIETMIQGIDHSIKHSTGMTYTVGRWEHETEKGLSFYLEYTGPLLGRGKECKVDITRKECVVYPTEQHEVLCSYPEYDIPQGAFLHVYSLAEVCVEKIAALTDRARNEPRDLYDLYFLLEGNYVRLEELAQGLSDKLSFETRQRSRQGLLEILQRKEARLRTLWKERLSMQMSSLPEFDMVFRIVQRHLRQSQLSL